MTQEQQASPSPTRIVAAGTGLVNSYYAILHLQPSAPAAEIRRAYRELSKRYHPDTTDLPPEVATAKFRELNEAYAALSNLERRSPDDWQVGHSPWNARQAATSSPGVPPSRSAYLDPRDRPLSPGEIFALLLLGLTLLGCLALAAVLALLGGEGVSPLS